MILYISLNINVSSLFNYCINCCRDYKWKNQLLKYFSLHFMRYIRYILMYFIFVLFYMVFYFHYWCGGYWLSSLWIGFGSARAYHCTLCALISMWNIRWMPLGFSSWITTLHTYILNMYNVFFIVSGPTLKSHRMTPWLKYVIRFKIL